MRRALPDSQCTAVVQSLCFASNNASSTHSLCFASNQFFEFLYENINKGLFIALDTKFRAFRSNIEDFEIFSGGDPHFENFEILFYNIIECLYITLETKFHASRSINEDFEIF